MRELAYSVLRGLISIYIEIAHFFGSKFFSNRIIRIATRMFDKKGIKNNGGNSWDLQIVKGKESEVFNRIAIEASLGLGETYMEGLWECKDLPGLAYHLFRHGSLQFDKSPVSRWLNWAMLGGLNLQTKAKAAEVIEKHYDIGNELYQGMLDSTMNYTCAYWARGAKNLAEAQTHKMELIAEKLQLKPGMRVLDLGCGFGGLSIFMAKNYGVSVVSINISKEQMAWAADHSKGLKVDWRLCDYRDVPSQEKGEQFDRIVSVGLMEHVGEHNYKEFFELIHKMLKDDGIALVHTIGVGHKDMFLIDPWVHKYIFPNGRLPYFTDIPNNLDGLFILEDYHNLGHDYYRTLLAWYENFSNNWGAIKKSADHFDPKFFRMWKYYLLMAAGTFQARKFNLYQCVFTKNGKEGGYVSVR